MGFSVGGLGLWDDLGIDIDAVSDMICTFNEIFSSCEPSAHL